MPEGRSKIDVPPQWLGGMMRAWPYWLRMLTAPLWAVVYMWRVQLLFMGTGVAAALILTVLRLNGLSDLSWLDIWLKPLVVCMIVLPASAATAAFAFFLAKAVSRFVPEPHGPVTTRRLHIGRRGIRIEVRSSGDRTA